MRIAWWNPQNDTRSHVERPYLEVPSPYDYMPPEPPQRDEEDDEESPRVIIIEM